VILNYEGQPTITRELERFFKISENVIRYLIVKKETRPMMRPGKKKEAEAKAGPETEAAPAGAEAPAPAEKAPPAPTENSGPAGQPEAQEPEAEKAETEPAPAGDKPEA